jgi:hypothetical protein
MKIGLAAAAAVLSAAMFAATAAATGPPQPVTFFTDGQITMPGTVVGVWHSTGAVVESGTYVEHYRLTGTGNTIIHFEKTLVGAEGTLVYAGNGIVISLSPTENGFSAGGWHIVDGTGAYATLHASGTPGAGGTVDTVTGVVHAFQAGTAHFDPPG